MKSQFIFGYEMNEADAKRVAAKLDYAAELNHGNFTFEKRDGCTRFTAPRRLGIEKCMRCAAFCDGYRLATWGI